MIELKDRVAIVTGGASGIGAATAATFAGLGAHVVIADIDAAGGDAHAERIRADGGSCIVVETDVRDEASVAAVVAAAMDAFGRLDVLHNNAAALELTAVDPEVTSLDADVWRQTFEANSLGPMLGCKHAIPAMLATGGGSIITTSSISGERGELNLTAYGASKAAVSQLTRSVAAQWGKRGIRCNAVAPGLVLTKNTRVYLPQDRVDVYVRHSLTPYVGEPQDIANAVAFLASDAARYVTGHVLYVDGGLANSLAITADFRDML